MKFSFGWREGGGGGEGEEKKEEERWDTLPHLSEFSGSAPVYHAIY